jgi:FlaA1/EpsC-like NDP-sugar epimerase
MVRNRYILLADLPLIAIAAFGAFALRFNWLFLDSRPEFLGYLAAAVLLKPLVFFPFGMYQRYWRYATALDLVAIVLAVTASAVAMAVFVGVGRATAYLPEFARPVLMIDWLLTLTLAGGLRMSFRVIGDAHRIGQKPESFKPRRVLVVGAGEAGMLVVRELRKNRQLGLNAVAFVDDAPGKWKKQILGIPVRGAISTLESVVTSDAIDDVIIAMPTVSGAVIRSATASCGRVGITPRIVPGVFELLDGHVTFSRLRGVEIADLLRRPQIVGRAGQIAYLTGQSVLITGAGGSIGSELARQVAFSGPKQLVLLGHGENSIFAVHEKLKQQYRGIQIDPVVADVRDAARLDAIFGRFKPDVVFHAAAHKHVPLMEANPEEAITNNVRGTRNVLEAAERSGVTRLVMISTDKAVAPSNVMGASKRLAEQLVLSAGRRLDRSYVVVRFGNVLGSRGSFVPTIQAQIERGGPITVTHPDMKRFFMTIPEAVQLVLQAGGMEASGELFVLNMGEQVRIVDLVEDLIRLSGFEPGEMPIEMTGIRAGEKLEEVLWEAGSTVTATSIPDVMRVREHDLQADSGIRTSVDDLITAAERGDLDSLQVLLELALPTYARLEASAGQITRSDQDATRTS